MHESVYVYVYAYEYISIFMMVTIQQIERQIKDGILPFPKKGELGLVWLLCLMVYQPL